MKVLIFGSRNLTWRHMDVMLWVATHAQLATPMPLGEFIRLWAHTPASEHNTDWQWLPESEPLRLLNGDGPPGSSVRGAIGADKLAVFACMQRWPEKRRGMRWFPPEPKEGESWAQAAGRRNAEMVATKPDRVYCVHENLDASKGSSMTAKMLTEAGIRFWLVTVSQAGAVLKVEER